jgi:hypothetical protein
MGELETLNPMRWHIVTLPDAVHDAARNAQMLGQHPDAPVRAAIAGAGLQGGVQNLLLPFGRPHAALAVPTADSCDRGHGVLGEGGAQRPHRGPGQMQLLRNRLIGDALVSPQHQASPSRYPLGRASVPNQASSSAFWLGVTAKAGAGANMLDYPAVPVE